MKTAIITGANHGIGLAIAEYLFSSGYNVFATYLRLSPENFGIDSQKLPESFSNFISQHQNIPPAYLKSWEADLTIEGNCERLFEHALVENANIGVLINNAAICIPDTFAFNNETMYQLPFDIRMAYKHFAINTIVPAKLMALFAYYYKKRHQTEGRIINISTDRTSGVMGKISYGASKSALESYSLSFALELGQLGITCNVLSLGPIQTGLIDKFTAQEYEQKLPTARIGNTGDVVKGVQFLLNSTWVTGQIICINGGHIIKCNA